MKIYKFLSMMWVILCVLAVARAATFNVNFNNVEQGPNSTSSPSLVVNNGKRVEDAKQVNSTPPNGEAAPAAAPLPELGGTTATETNVPVIQPLPERRRRPFQFDITAFMTGGGFELSGRPGMAAAFTWNPWKYFGLRAFTGVILGERFMEGFRGDFLIENTPQGHSRLLAGAETEVIPLHVSLFGSEEWLALGAFGGVSTMSYRSGDPLSMAHLGARARMRFGDAVGAVAQMRFNFQYFAFETGLSFNF
jgi:hypothetical protein